MYQITAPKFDQSEIDMIKKCLDSGWVTQGPMVQNFEAAFAKRHQAEFALATTSCTAALHLATLALNLKPNDEVIVPAFTWVTSAHSAEYVGAKAVFADVEFSTFNLDPKAFEAAITPNTKAVVVVHLFGLSAKMDEIMAIAKKHNIAVIEDAACAVGTTYAGKPIGAIGDLGCFSFHPRKVITTGEGGMVTTNNSQLANLVKSFRNHGATGHPDMSANKMRPYTMGTFNNLGFNLRLSDIQAAVGLAQMQKLDALLEERRLRAFRYLDTMKDIAELELPMRSNDKLGHSYQSFVVRVLKGGNSRRNKIMDILEEKKIQTRPGTHAAHRLGYYTKKYGIKAEQFPIACACEDTTITLPIYPGMTDKDQDFIVEQVKQALT